MESKDEKYLILEQYRIYSDAKEKFIERQFSSNKFYLIVNLVIFITAFVIGGLFPNPESIIVLVALIGVAVSIMWWMNIDTYQVLIKIKYAKVLEYLETKLPEQPYHKEYVDYEQAKKRKHLIVFGDFQKVLAVIIMVIHFYICLTKIINLIQLRLL